MSPLSHTRNQGKVTSALLEKAWTGRKAVNWELGSLGHIHPHVDDAAFTVLRK